MDTNIDSVLLYTASYYRPGKYAQCSNLCNALEYVFFMPGNNMCINYYAIRSEPRLQTHAEIKCALLKGATETSVEMLELNINDKGAFRRFTAWGPYLRLSRDVAWRGGFSPSDQSKGPAAKRAIHHPCQGDLKLYAPSVTGPVRGTSRPLTTSS